MKVYGRVIVPVNDYFKTISEWNGIDHIELLANYFELFDSDNNANFLIHFKKMLVRAVAGCMDFIPNYYAFVLVYNKQDNDLADILKWLSPSQLSNYCKDKIELNDYGLEWLIDNFLINIQDLSKLSKIEINNLYDHIRTSQLDFIPSGKVRRSIFVKTCSFICSSSNVDFLRNFEETCNWICFMIRNINKNYKKDIDINNIWSQVLHLYKSRFDYRVDLNEIVKANARLMLINPLSFN